MNTVSCATSSLLAAPAEGYFFSSRGLRQMFAKYYFKNPKHVTLPQSSKASCLGIVSPGYDGAHMVHPLAWPTQPLGYPASPQRAGRWSPWTPKKKQMNNPFYYSLTRRSRVKVLSTRAGNNDTWDRRRIVNNMR
jgi:hypothetical protein